MAQFVNPQQLMHNPSGPDTATHPSSLHTDMPPYFLLPDGKRLVRLPRAMLFTPAQKSTSAITFSASGFPGVRVKDVLRATVLVDEPSDRVFEHHGWRTTNIALEWPGYDPRPVNDPGHLRLPAIVDGAPITRNQLAGEICSLLWMYKNKVSGRPVTRGFERWAFSPNATHVSDIWLLSLHHYRNVWIPEFYVRDRALSI
ncbi:hypothetical protein BV22DRAFT_1199458 [Leucogyrophana mollusca]|uniref:Uncharacterized protein n=1 Tax=Leucogyrophana mollusca TaxID=85980 RepID=A0ACB8B1H2_9AGAM|nr:hypothetical protein BV22DRAFT_1199458 [Leucogyrophana mollusca]